MVRIAKPAFVSVFLVLTLLATMLTPVLGKGDGVEEIIARLQTAKDPAVAFLKLDSSQRQVVQEYLTLATVVDGASAPVADAAEGMAAAAGGCWTWTWNRQGRNILGVVLWQFNQKIDWCSNGSTLTSKYRQVWTSNMSIFWSYNGLVADSTSGGVGSSSCHSFVQGSYDYCLPGVGCLYHDYPWLDMTAHADGRGTGSGGG